MRLIEGAALVGALVAASGMLAGCDAQSQNGAVAEVEEAVTEIREAVGDVKPPAAAVNEPATPEADSGELQIGSMAPGFELPGSDGNTHTLADYQGQYVAIAFFPKAFTGG